MFVITWNSSWTSQSGSSFREKTPNSKVNSEEGGICRQWSYTSNSSCISGNTSTFRTWTSMLRTTCCLPRTEWRRTWSISRATLTGWYPPWTKRSMFCRCRHMRWACLQNTSTSFPCWRTTSSSIGTSKRSDKDSRMTLAFCCIRFRIGYWVSRTTSMNREVKWVTKVQALDQDVTQTTSPWWTTRWTPSVPLGTLTLANKAQPKKARTSRS